MADALVWHRLQFAFTIVYHYLFPQLTMGLALLIVVMKVIALRKNDEHYRELARFWTRIFGVNFAVGVVTGIPMEFQFGTNWSRFSSYAGGIIGQTLGMEGMFAFFLESTFLGLMLFGEKRLGEKKHLGVSIALMVGSWLSGYFIIVTNAFMQHPVGYRVTESGKLVLADMGAFLLNPWALAQYAHNMTASVLTASFVVTAVGAFWMLRGQYREHARRMVTVSLRAGMIASVLIAMPTGDISAKAVATHQPVTLAAMEGRFESGPMAEMVVLGQPNVEAERLDNPVVVPGVLSFLAYGSVHADVKGLKEFPKDQWPTNIELLYYAYHVMVGLGTMFMALMLLGNFAQLRKKLEQWRMLLWALMIAFPFPYIATTAGWMAAELGRQPWLIYGLLRTADGSSPKVHSGTALFSLIGFTGLYFVLGLLFVYLVGRDILRGPEAKAHGHHEEAHG